MFYGGWGVEEGDGGGEGEVGGEGDSIGGVVDKQEVHAITTITPNAIKTNPTTINIPNPIIHPPILDLNPTYIKISPTENNPNPPTNINNSNIINK